MMNCNERHEHVRNQSWVKAFCTSAVKCMATFLQKPSQRISIQMHTQVHRVQYSTTMYYIHRTFIGVKFQRQTSASFSLASLCLLSLLHHLGLFVCMRSKARKPRAHYQSKFYEWQRFKNLAVMQSSMCWTFVQRLAARPGLGYNMCLFF